MGVIVKQSIKGTAVTYVGVALGFLTTFFVATRFLTTEEVGLSRTLVDAATILVGLMQLGTSSSIIRFYPYFRDKESDDHGFFGLTLLIPLIGFAVFGMLYIVAYTPLSQWFGEKSPLFVDYYYAVLPIALFLLYQTVFETTANVKMKIVFPRFVREVVTRLGLLVTYLLYAGHILSIDGFVAGLAVSYGICALLNGAYLMRLKVRRVRPDWRYLMENKPLVRRYMVYTGFLLVSALTGILAPALSSFFITAKMGLNYTGIFAIATYMAVMVSIPYRSLTAIAQPELSQAIKDGDRPKVKSLLQKVATNLLLAGGFILLTIWINIDLIYVILPKGETYAAARNVVLILGLGQLITAVFSFCLSAISYSRYFGWTLVLSLGYTVLCIGLNNALVVDYGMEGAAWAGFMGSAIYYAAIVLTLWLTTRTHPFAKKQAEAVVLFATVFGLNEVLVRVLPLGVWGSSIVRSVVLLIPAVVAAYRMGLSQEVKEMIDQKRKKLCKR